MNGSRRAGGSGKLPTSVSRGFACCPPFVLEPEFPYPALDVRHIKATGLTFDDPGGVLDLALRTARAGPLELGYENVFRSREVKSQAIDDVSPLELRQAELALLPNNEIGFARAFDIDDVELRVLPNGFQCGVPVRGSTGRMEILPAARLFAPGSARSRHRCRECRSTRRRIGSIEGRRQRG